ncbi:MAG: AAA-like domain-containing protein [Verrucomicrobia bacterium]|nr:AAA-like domain-containing protein [Verrucomicrobiota bacterium]
MATNATSTSASSVSGSPSSPAPGAAASAGPSEKIRVVLLYKRHLPADKYVLELLEKELGAHGYQVWIDRHLTLGVEWAKEIEQKIRDAHAVIGLLSEDSSRSEMIAFEIENAHESSQQQQGRPRLLPIRVNFTGPLPEPLSGILDPIQYVLWEDPRDDQRVVSEVLTALKSLAPSKPPVRIIPTKGLRLMPRPAVQPRPLAVAKTAPSMPLPLEPIGGAVPLNSEFYVVRSADGELRTALTRYDSIVLIKGGRQIGKTSMLARGLQFARERGAKVALTDFQKFNASNLETVGNFYLSLAESLADQLEISTLPSDVWDERRGPNVNFERFIRREVLAKLNAPLVWGLDEVDRLFVCSYGSEVFGLFRSWHNERALDPSGPWAGLTLAIAYATEAHLFITDMNQSPFNIGTRLVLEDFTSEQVADLNRRNGSPLKNPGELDRFRQLVDGHPFLVRRGLHEMVSKKTDIAAFESQADRDEGIFGDHLRRILVLLARDPALTEVVKALLRGQPCPTPESFYRLRSAGVITGGSQAESKFRCQLYAAYLKRHLLG